MQKEKLDYDHLLEKQKELQQRERAFEEQKELQRKLIMEIEEKHKKLQILNNEIKTKQNILKNIKPNLNNQSSQSSLQDELVLRDKQIDQLNDRLIIQDHELRELRSVKGSVDKLKKLEQELDVKDSAISELKKKIMQQEETINSFLESISSKKKEIDEKEKKIKEIEQEYSNLEFQYESLNNQFQEQNNQIKNLTNQNSTLNQDKENLEQKLATVQDKNKYLDKQLQSQKTEFEETIQEKDSDIQDLRQKYQQLSKESEERIQKLLNELQKTNTQYDLDRSNSKKQIETLIEELSKIRQEYDKFRQEKEIEDLLLVKFEIATINENMLSDKQTKIEDLEREKAKLENKIQEISSEFNLVISTQKSLKEKVTIFQTKCIDLEKRLSQNQEDSQGEIGKLRRENQLLNDTQQNSEKAIEKLTKQVESLIEEKNYEIKKLKKDNEVLVQQEKERANGLEKQFRRSLIEKEVLEEQLHKFYAQLEKVEQKISDKNQEINNYQAQISKLNAKEQIEEMKEQMKKMKAEKSKELIELEKKCHEKDSEIQVLKEMVRGIKLQLKSKDTDIQRLNIKIKRLEKTNEIRENVILEQTQTEAKLNSQLNKNASQSENCQIKPNESNLLQQRPQLSNLGSRKSLIERDSNFSQALEDKPYQHILPPISTTHNGSQMQNNNSKALISQKHKSSKLSMLPKGQKGFGHVKLLDQSMENPHSYFGDQKEEGRYQRRRSQNRVQRIIQQSAGKKVATMEQNYKQMVASNATGREDKSDNTLNEFMEQQRDIMKQLNEL